MWEFAETAVKYLNLFLTYMQDFHKDIVLQYFISDAVFKDSRDNIRLKG